MYESLPRVLIVGGEDVHARIPLMRGLADEFNVAAAGTSTHGSERFANAGFAYYPYSLSRRLGPCSDLLGLAGLWRVISDYRPDVVHAFDTKPGVYGCLAASFAGVPVVIGTITGLGSLYGASMWTNRSASQCTFGASAPLAGESLRVPIVRGIYERLQRLASRHSDLTIFQNTSDCREFIARRVVPASKAVVIAGSGVDTNVFHPSRTAAVERAAQGIPEDAVVVTLLSRVIRSKGIEEFAASAEVVRREEPKAHFLLIGPADTDSPDRFTPGELEHVTRAVHWLGARSDVPQVLAASDIFVLPSALREGIPRVLLEAASMALPIVTTDTPGCNDVVEEGSNGFLTTPGDVPALADRVLRLVRDLPLRQRFGAESRRRAVERFDLSVVVAQMRRFYREILAKKTMKACASQPWVPVAG